jgi:hypothetical protein
LIPKHRAKGAKNYCHGRHGGQLRLLHSSCSRD